VLRRCAAISGIDRVVCATVEGIESAAIAEIAGQYGALVYRGSETDVLERYAGAAKAAGADVVMRVTSDCPLIDPEICGAVLKQRAKEKAEYAANNLVHGYPHGLDCEAFTRRALDAADVAATEPYDREHVTPWIRNKSDYRKASVEGPGGPRAKWRWTLDYPEDLDFLRALFRYLPRPPAMPSWRAIATLVEQHPELAEINAARRQR
jgi:glutamate-1-semialdehyde 2,1-aminomutase/spore coat polysaccharide biosynthesis protein SpsF